MVQGPVIGQGANGNVVRADLNGSAVAVKHVNTNAAKSFQQL